MSQPQDDGTCRARPAPISLSIVICTMNRAKSLRSALACIAQARLPGGNTELIVVDNGPVEDNTLPYHGPYIAKELTIAQLEHYGFKFEGYEQIIPQRYLLRFRLVAP